MIWQEKFRLDSFHCQISSKSLYRWSLQDFRVTINKPKIGATRDLKFILAIICKCIYSFLTTRAVLSLSVSQEHIFCAGWNWINLVYRDHRFQVSFFFSLHVHLWICLPEQTVNKLWWVECSSITEKAETLACKCHKLWHFNSVLPWGYLCISIPPGSQTEARCVCWCCRSVF